MPAATIDTLEIAIQVQSDDAERRLDRFLDKLRAIGTATNGAGTVSARIRDITPDSAGLDTASKKIERIGDAASSSGSRIRDFSRDIKASGEAAGHSVSGLSKFLDTLRRVAYMRFVRSILRGIVSAFKEGITNLYQWSSAVNGTFAASMDRLATSTQYLKNSLGAMLAPLIEALAPVLEWVIDRIVDVFNWITAMLAALSGSSTYTVAKKVSTTWGDTTKQIKTGTDSARESVEQLKRSILGFDEINKLDAPDTSGGSGKTGGGGSTSTGPSPSDMFETRQLDGWMLGLSNMISKLKMGLPALFAPIVAGFAAIKAAIEGVIKKTREWLKDLAEAGKTVIEVGVSLVRKGWKTLTGWVLSFGSATVSVAVAIATSAAALWAKLKKDWQALGAKTLSVAVAIATGVSVLWRNLKAAWAAAAKEHLLQVAVALATSAAVLWRSLKSAWGAAKDHALQLSAQIITTAAALWKGIKAGWAALGVKALTVTVALATSAKALWTALKGAWGDAKNHVLQVGIAIATGASVLWRDIKAAWGAASTHVLTVAAQITTTAATLWKSLKQSWGAAKDHVLQLSAQVSTAASALWKDVKQGWAALGLKVLSVGVVISTAAATLWKSVKDGWKAIGQKVLTFGVAISTTAQSLWNGLKASWFAIQSRVVQFSVSITQTAAGLWNGLKASWLAIQSRIVQFSVSIAQTAQSLWNGLKAAWEAVPDKVLSFGVQISTVVSRLWDWLKENWAKVALVALGFAVAIATPWGTIATALAGLWADVMASFGGSLAFGIAPSMNGSGALKTPQEVKDEMDTNVIRPISELLDEQDYQVFMTAHANPGNGLSRKEAYGGGLKLSPIDSITSSVDVGTNPGNGLSTTTTGLALSPVADTSTTVNVGLSPVWSLITGILAFLGLTNLTTTVKINAVAGKGFSSIDSSGKFKLVGIKDSEAYISAKTQWGEKHQSLAQWIGLNDLKGDAYVSVSTQWGNAGASLRRWIGLEDDLSATANIHVGLSTEWGIHGSYSWKDYIKFQDNVYTTLHVNISTEWWDHGCYSWEQWINYKSDIYTTHHVRTVQENAAGGVVTANGSWRFASGGVISNGIAKRLSNIPHYAGGTRDAHGTLFLAGEAGPEIVGHVGGRTEILNQSQLAQTMFAAVRSAMTGVRIGGYIENAVPDGRSEADYEAMYRAMYDAFTDAMAGNAERDKEKLALMREIAAKDFNPEISTASINRAQMRINRRAGTTIVPVGT